MLNVTPRNLWDEARIALDIRRKHTDISEEIIRSVAGDNYRSDWRASQPVRENYGWEFQVNFIPNIVANNPAVSVSVPGGSDEDSEESRIRTIALNQWTREQNLKQALIQCAFDTTVDFGVLMVDLEPLPIGSYDPDDPHMPSSPMRPRVRSLSPTLYFHDPVVIERDRPRYMGNIWIGDRQDMLDARDAEGKRIYDPEVIELIGKDSEVDRVHEMLMSQHVTRLPSRDQIVGMDLYVPETRMIYSIPYGGVSAERMREGAFLRPPRRYYGLARGPYVLVGYYWVRDQPYPLSPLAVTKGLGDELQAHASQAAEDAASAKRLFFFDANNKQLGQSIRSFANGSVVPIPGFNMNHAAVEFGGAQTANLQYIQILRDRIDRQTGITDTIRGNLRGVTKGEVDQAQSNADIRTRFAAACFRDAVVEVYRRVLYLFETVPYIRQRVNNSEVGDGGQGSFWVHGGQQDDPEKMREINVDIYGISIEPYSMEMVDQIEMQRRMQAAFSIVKEASMLMPQTPHIRWNNMIEDLFTAFNINGAGSRYLDMEMLGQIIRSDEEKRALEIETRYMSAVPSPPDEPRAPHRHRVGSGSFTDDNGTTERDSPRRRVRSKAVQEKRDEKAGQGTHHSPKRA